MVYSVLAALALLFQAQQTAPIQETPPTLTTDALMVYWRLEAKAQKAQADALRANELVQKAANDRDAQIALLRRQCGDSYNLVIIGEDTLACQKKPDVADNNKPVKKVD